VNPSSGKAPRIGVFGGAFDPPHNAHVALARAALEQLGLAALHVFPTGHAWHKVRELTPAQDRLAMAQLAFGGIPGVVVDSREMLRDGLTTWAEWNGPDSRSDCHAWGASPNFELFRTLAGVEPAAPGYSKVSISPNLGTLHHLNAVVPHPRGEIEVDLHASNVANEADITLPPGITGTLHWLNVNHPLQPGHNHISIRGEH